MALLDRVDEIRERLRAVADPLALLEGIFTYSPLALQIYLPSGQSLLTNRAFRDLFGSEPPPDYNVLEDDIARENGMHALIERAFRGETVHLPVTWYDPRQLQQVRIEEGKRVAIEVTFFPLFRADGAIGHVAVVFEDVTAEQMARLETEAERDLLRLIVAQSGDGVIVCDEHGKLRLFNPEAERQHGTGLHEVASPEWAATYGLFREDGAPLPLEETPLYRAVKGERVEGARWRVRRPDGTLRTLSGTAVPLRKETGALAGAVLVCRDETERLAHEQERAALLLKEQAARGEAEQANRAKDEFLAMLGHELRNPLAPVLTALQLLRMRGADWGRELEVIDRQVSHLARLVDDLLDVSRIARGAIEVRKAPLEIASALQRALEMARPLFEARQHTLLLEAPKESLRVLGDETRLAQALANLLTNAARYTEPGGEVRIRAAREGDRAVIEVSDNGIGIAADLLPRIFDPFVQGTPRAAHAEGGLGLGLALAKNLVQIHGGTLGAESPGPGRGSTFRVSLPAVEGAVLPAAAAPRLAPGSAAPSRRILLVDDNRDAAELLADALRLHGHEVAVAYDGPSALGLLGTFTPDAAVLDIGLPGMDGHALAAELQKKIGRSVPLIALTGYGQDRDRALSTAAGFSFHLVKPVDLQQLIDVVDRSQSARL
ncbi:MAG: hypothetical protein NVSMB23_22400 [Myxococcales bacterium]